MLSRKEICTKKLSGINNTNGYYIMNEEACEETVAYVAKISLVINQSKFVKLEVQY